jgi:Ca2+-binding RTX toxin-like protein
VDLATGLATDGFGAFDTLISIEDVRGSGQADLLTGSAGANVLRGLGGTDTLDGRGGVDTANYAADAVFGGNAGIVVDLGAGWALDGYGDADALVSIENIVGTDGASMVFLGYSDLVIGSAGANRLEGRGGNDVLSGGGGADTVMGETGDDLLSGDAGNDTIIGGAGLDVMVGGADADTFTIDLAALVNLQGDLVYDFQIGLDSIVVPLSVQGQTAFIDQAVTVSLAGGGLYWMIVSGATAAEIQAATKFT